jgi:hypothetical protein
MMTRRAPWSTSVSGYSYANPCCLHGGNAEGAANGYKVSTFSPAPSVLAPKGEQAIYTCPAGTSDGAYAQCDGGICLTSTEGKLFPGSDGPLKQDQIICSCPITRAKRTAKIGYQIADPYPCQQSYFQNCKRAVANAKTGSTIYVGAPTGTARLLTRLLLGHGPTFERVPPAARLRTVAALTAARST